MRPQDLRRKNRQVAMVWLAICLTLLVSAILVIVIRGPIARKASGTRGKAGPPVIYLAKSGAPIDAGRSG